MHVAEPPMPPYATQQAPLLRSFIDSNILVYADSDDEPAKQQQAALLLGRLLLARSGVISTQVLNEYVNVGIKKLKLANTRLRQQLQFHRQFEMVIVTPDITETAIDLHQTRSLSFYDALIVASALTSGCSVLYSEDMNSNESIKGLRVVNPFAIE
jgi:predicted nucleic acid-binding protein